MNIFSVLSLIGGLAFFLYGMNVMSGGLEKLSGGNLETILEKMTSSLWKSVMLGGVITIAVQSSSAVTVMLVGLVNSGIMKLGQTIGVIMGSNVGTTVTTWIFTLNDIGSGDSLLGLLKPENFSTVFALVGIFMIMLSKKKKRRDVGTILIGFAILMFGMKLMGDSVGGLKDSPQFANLMTAFKNPLVAVLAATVITGVIQSSAASVGILMTLSRTGVISYSMAIPLVLGCNIGTCATALLSSIGVNKNAKRVAVVHTLIKIIGTIVCLVILIIVPLIFADIGGFLEKSTNSTGIAIIHTAFNVLNTIILLPFSKLLEKLAKLIVRKKGEDEEESYTLIDDRLLDTPGLAIAESTKAAVRMARIAEKSAIDGLGLYDKFDADKASAILENEEKIDSFEDSLGTFLVKFAGHALSEKEGHKVTNLLTAIGDFERIGDHAVNLVEGSKEVLEKEIVFSEGASAEMHTLMSAVVEILNLTVDAFEYNDIARAKMVEPLEQVIDGLVSTIRKNHIERLTSGICTIELGFVLSDFLTNCERISDHCSNVAAELIEIETDALDIHRYLNGVKNTGDSQFKEDFAVFSEKYSI